MKSMIRAYALRLKEDCEDWRSPVPRWLRAVLHAWGKRLYCGTYGLTPKRVDELLEGVEADAVDIIYANRCRKEYGATFRADGKTSFHGFCMGEHALLAMLAYNDMQGNWLRMLSINGIHLERMSGIEDPDETAERYDLPKGTRFYYREPDEPEDESLCLEPDPYAELRP